jgi:hypothetical protein
MHLTRAVLVNAEDRKVGPIPLPWFIPICIFTPFFITFLLFFSYQQTIIRYRNKQASLTDERDEQEVSRDVEMQVRSFLNPMEGKRGGLAVTRE